MKEAFKKFCKEINFEINFELEESIINDVSLIEKKDISNNKIKQITNFDVSFFSIPTKDQLNEFIKKSIKFFNPTEVNFQFNFLNKNYSNERIYQVLQVGSNFLFKKDLNNYFSIENINYDLEQNSATIWFNSLIQHNLFENEININQIVKLFSIDDLKINIINKSNHNFEELAKQEELNNKKDFELLKSMKKTEILGPKQNNNYLNKNSNKKYFKTSLTDFYGINEQFLLVEGKVFSIEKNITKTGMIVTSILITDEKEAILAKYFTREGNEDKYNWIQNGMKLSIFGEKKQEFNSSSYFLQVNKIDEIKEEKFVDDAKEKRIELSARTSMSAMDGFIDSVEMMKFVKSIGHEAIAFVDFQNIQAFPDIYNNAKKIGIKPIYGSTFSVVSKKHNLIWNTKEDKNIKNERYVIFDLETTSLNPRTGEIIEFGAVIVDNQKITETIQFFIKPSMSISQFTTDLTGISQKMLDEQSMFNNQKDALSKILEIFKDSTVVAHNANFDIGYIKEKMYQNNLGEFKNQVIDTLALARFLFPVSQSYRLEVVSKKMSIIYDPTIAHRADYDAKVLEQVWMNMIDMLELKGIKTFKQIEDINEPWLHDKKHGYDLAIYVKNQAGLKELFQLVSKSLTTNYFGGPKLFEEDIKKSPNLLFAPASINTKLIDLMQTGTTIDLNNEIDKWDFIGIPSPHLFSHLISRGNFSELELKEMLKEITLLAKQKGKIIVAIGDVRYLTDNDKLGHSVYINTKGLEGRRHPLYRYNEINPNYPNQKIFTTNEMIEQFEFLNSSDLSYEIVIKNPNLINSMIDENIEVIKSKLYPPKFDNSEENLNKLVYENAHKIYGEVLPKIVEDRIKRELDPINKYGFSVVYWISQKLVSKSLSDGYLVGSRGSVGSSIVATLSGITEVNPLIPHYICLQCQNVEFVENSKTTSGFDLPSKNCPKCNLEMKRDGQTIPFETFLGFDGDKVPDIDLNFSGVYQPIIHQEVRRLFGEKHTFRAGTISTVASKTAFGFVKKYFEEIGENKSNHFAGYLAQKIEGSKRTTGQHPGGIIIIPKEFDVEDFTPINYPANDISSSWQTTHFDFHAIHDNVLKLDLLGHDDPTAIRQLQKLTNVKMKEISFSDEKVMKLFSSTEPLGIKPEDINNEPTGVLGIPEFGTKFVRKMLKVAKPSSFNDLINISGLSHGTDVWNGNAEELVKNGKKLNEVISCRDDIMVYLMKKGVEPSLSFQIMEKVRKGKGLTPEDEKILKEIGIEKWYIDSLNKIKYMFPKAHATAYVMMAWRIAWFKIYYPLEYYATFFTVRSDVFDIESSMGSKTQVEKKLKELEAKQYSKEKISTKEESLIPIFEIINEMLARGMKISNIDLYNSNATEWKIDYENKSLIPPFIVLDGLGEAAAKSIVSARTEKEFTSKDDLLKRTQLNKTVLEKMEQLGIVSNLENTDQFKLF